MTLLELTTFLNENTNFEFCNSESDLLQALDESNSGSLQEQILQHIAKKCQCADGGCVVQREDVVTALAPLRLEYMKDDAPVDGFRMVEGTIVGIDLAFNEEALKNKK